MLSLIFRQYRLPRIPMDQGCQEFEVYLPEPDSFRFFSYTPPPPPLIGALSNLQKGRLGALKTGFRVYGAPEYESRYSIRTSILAQAQ